MDGARRHSPLVISVIASIHSARLVAAEIDEVIDRKPFDLHARCDGFKLTRPATKTVKPSNEIPQRLLIDGSAEWPSTVPAGAVEVPYHLEDHAT
jgi:hypothetical protein